MGGGRRRAWRFVRAVAGASLVGGCAAHTPPPVVLPPAAAVVPAGQDAAPIAPPDTARPRRGGSSIGDTRFLILAVDDSTVTMLAPRDRWLRPGTYGIAVDPGRRDALVARLYVQTRNADTTVALVTGQTTRMSTDYVAIFRRPGTPVLKQGSFWGGLATGVAVGAGILALLARRD